MKITYSESELPQAGDKLAHSGNWTVVTYEKSHATLAYSILDPDNSRREGTEIVWGPFLFGLTAERAVEQVTGEPVAILTIDSCYGDVNISPIDGGPSEVATTWKLRRMGFEHGDEFYLIKKEVAK